MPALWQASQRPMYVRTVWVDGFRHAILSHDDPYYLKLNSKNRRPYSSASVSNKLPKKESRLINHTDDLEDCLRKFNLIIRKERIPLPNKLHRHSYNGFHIEKLDLTDVDNDSEDDEFLLQATPQPLNEFDTLRSNYNYNMKNLKTVRTARAEVRDNTELSDRVLQWLDLAGKVDLLAPEKVERMTQPRHSWPEIQSKNHSLVKSKTAVDVRVRDSMKTYTAKICDSAKAQQSGTIDRHDFYVPTSANTIENYARQSRNVKNTPRVETNGKTKDISHKTRSKESRLNVAEARQKIVTERSAVEKQYAELVSKKLIPDLGMTCKKQVHIFMPELLKKLHSNATSRTESLLSQKS
jgi:hypothetical protein